MFIRIIYIEIFFSYHKFLDYKRLLRSQNAILILVTVLNRDFCCRRWMDGSWDAHLASPADFFAGADDITT